MIINIRGVYRIFKTRGRFNSKEGVDSPFVVYAFSLPHITRGIVLFHMQGANTHYAPMLYSVRCTHVPLFNKTQILLLLEPWWKYFCPPKSRKKWDLPLMKYSWTRFCLPNIGFWENYLYIIILHLFSSR